MDDEPEYGCDYNDDDGYEDVEQHLGLVPAARYLQTSDACTRIDLATAWRAAHQGIRVPARINVTLPVDPIG
jgi:hypothetical protein